MFKVADSISEFEQIHALNYRTFVEEIPQHQPTGSGSLVDKFHNENVYIIALVEERLVGMMAVRDSRPFSLDSKLASLDEYLPEGRSVCEVRLLSIEPEVRGAKGGRILAGMLALLRQVGIDQGWDFAIVSGTTRQAKLYRHLGFEPFGPLVGTGEAMFQPMGISLETFDSKMNRLLYPVAEPINLMTGPVALTADVTRAFEQAPISHRSDEFRTCLRAVKSKLCELTGASQVSLAMGSGTLANDIIAAQLIGLPGPGLILSNGEFGERLVDHATRMGLKFERLSIPWRNSFDVEVVAAAIRSLPPGSWVWAAHCETSTSKINDVARLAEICDRAGVKLCLDCVSSLGCTPVDLSRVYLASSSSGKGLRSYPGVAIVFFNHRLLGSVDAVPRYLDLAQYASEDSVPFTFSSNLLGALWAALDGVDWDRRFAALADLSQWFASLFVSREVEV
ncbi:MAG TPA: aminotransferase class V-fold PLP-dependent enzyme, partial [Fimbriimonas sp.]|nr:aminotransferase class V-fold PLP-dependent enzyme [Fimbriimonas sp.]